MTIRTVIRALLAIALGGLATSALAEISADQIARLDKDLTPIGAERAGNAAGTGARMALLSRKARAEGHAPLTLRDVLTAMIKAHEIQGVIALENSFNRVGLDHVLLVRVASTAVVTRMLGGTREQVIDAVSNARIDGGALRTYRHAPNTGSRKSWAAGDATSRTQQQSALSATEMASMFTLARASAPHSLANTPGLFSRPMQN